MNKYNKIPFLIQNTNETKSIKSSNNINHYPLNLYHPGYYDHQGLLPNTYHTEVDYNSNVLEQVGGASSNHYIMNNVIFHFHF